MDRPIVMIIDVLLNETIVREMNDEEYTQYLIDIEKNKPIDQ